MNHPNAKLDKLALDELPKPLFARMPGQALPCAIHDICPIKARVLIALQGGFDDRAFDEVTEIVDGEGNNHNPDLYWLIKFERNA